MQFPALFLTTGLLATLTSATPQSPEQTTSAALGIASYLSAALATDSGLASAVAAVETNSALASSLEAWASSVAPALTGSLTAVPSVDLAGLPTEVRGPFSSALNAYSSGVVSVATANGFSVSASGSGSGSGSGGASASATGASSAGVGAVSSKASQAGAEATGRALGAAAGVAVGFVGLVAAL